MQHLENDMEELFKRAGENYSPQKGKGDWESIAKRIADKSNSPTAVKHAGKSRNRKIAVMFLLLFIVSAGFFATITSTSTSSVADKQSEKPAITKNMARTTNGKNNNCDSQRAAASADFASANKVNDKQDVYWLPTSKGMAEIGQTVLLERSRDFNDSSRVWPGKTRKNDFVNDHNSHTESRSAQAANTVEPPLPGTAASKNREADVEILEKGQLEIVLSKEDNAATRQKSKAVENIHQKSKGFYIGLIASTDFSKVKSAAYDNTGFDAGLVAGYQLHKKLSFETGVILNKKTYHSEGQYFSMAKMGAAMPAGVSINKVKSRSTLVEIPLRVKYNLVQKRNSVFFIGAGVSAYIMTSEKNMYDITLNGNQEKMVGEYKVNSYGIPAVAGISAGYEQQMTPKIDLRFEPFVKVPLRGIGVGSLPVTTAGFQVLITHRL